MHPHAYHQHSLHRSAPLVHGRELRGHAPRHSRTMGSENGDADMYLKPSSRGWSLWARHFTAYARSSSAGVTPALSAACSLLTAP